MKQILFTACLAINLVSAFGQEMTKEQSKVVVEFIDCIKTHNIDKLISKVSFPLNREYPIPSIKNKEDFLKRFQEVFDDKLTQTIVNSNPIKDWSSVGWRGIMLLDGEVWLDDDGRLLGVNYQSEIESKKRDELIKQDKSQLYMSLKDFKAPIHILETTKYRIRIDDMGNNNYRYSSWKLDHKMSEKPDIVILNGEFVSEGNGGNHSFVFTNGEYKYVCEIIVMGDMDSPPANLIIYQGEKEIFSQSALVVRY